MLQEEHSAILLTFIKLPFVIRICVLSTFEWPLKTGFTVPGRGPMMWRMPLHVNQKSDYDDMMSLYISATSCSCKLCRMLQSEIFI